MITAVLVGGDLDGQRWQLDDDPDRPRPAILTDMPGPPLAWTWRDLLYPTLPIPARVGVYELVCAADQRPARGDDGSYRYEWKGIH